jgi:hypothetical protein
VSSWRHPGVIQASSRQGRCASRKRKGKGTRWVQCPLANAWGKTPARWWRVRQSVKPRSPWDATERATHSRGSEAEFSLLQMARQRVSDTQPSPRDKPVRAPELPTARGDHVGRKATQASPWTRGKEHAACSAHKDTPRLLGHAKSQPGHGRSSHDAANVP